jgi:hypothetical protein
MLDPEETAFVETVVLPKKDDVGVNALATETKEAMAMIENFILFPFVEER